MFRGLGILLLGYTLYAAWRGQVYAKDRAWGRSIQRDEQPNYFRVVIGIYGALAVALIFVF